MNSNIADREKMSFLQQSAHSSTQRNATHKATRLGDKAERLALNEKNLHLSGEKSGLLSRSAFFSQLSSFQKNLFSQENTFFSNHSSSKENNFNGEIKESSVRDFSRVDEKPWKKDESLGASAKEDWSAKEEIKSDSGNDVSETAEAAQQKQKIGEEKSASEQNQQALVQEIKGFIAELENLLRTLRTSGENGGNGGNGDLPGSPDKNGDSSGKKNDFFGQDKMLQKANVLLKKLSQLGSDANAMHQDLKKFLKNIVENGFNDLSKGQWKNALGDLSARYHQDHFIEKKVMHNPAISATLVEKENPEVFLGSMRKNLSQAGEENKNVGQNDGGRDFSSRAGRQHLERSTTNAANNAASAATQQKNLSANLSANISAKTAANPQLLNKTTLGQSSSFSRLFDKDGEAVSFGKDFGGWGDISPKNKSSFSAGLSKTTMLDSQQKERIMQTIVGKIKQSYRGGQENFSLKLRPQELGSVDVFMRKENGKVTLRLTVESQAVKEAVESRLSDISQHLLQSDIELSELDVHVGHDSGDKNAQGAFSSELGEGGQGEGASGRTREKDEAVRHSQAQELSEAMNWSLNGSMQRFYA